MADGGRSARGMAEQRALSRASFAVVARPPQGRPKAAEVTFSGPSIVRAQRAKLWDVDLVRFARDELDKAICRQWFADPIALEVMAAANVEKLQLLTRPDALGDDF